ncbi:MAG TPA: CoA-binding protein, partial [bacterium]|nr:CoA-binding protein [bacterium]
MASKWNPVWKWTHLYRQDFKGAKMTAEEILKTKKSFAIIGATSNKERYGYEVFEILHANGYQVFPINPKYAEIDGVTCYPSLMALNQPPDVLITALAPTNTEKVIDSVKSLGIETVWMPPGCWSDEAVKKCQQLELNFIYDECLVGILK